LTDFAKDFEIPCVGGKVSLYNETSDGPIKPTPVIGVIGLIDKKPLKIQKINSGDSLIMIGNTKDELGGSEYSEYIHKFIGGKCPAVDFSESKKNMNSVLDIIENELIKSAHDCSKGGLTIAISELCMINQIGCNVSLEKIPGEKLDSDKILFSESHSRYLVTFENKNLEKLEEVLKKHNVSYSLIGEFTGDSILFSSDSKPIIDLSVDKAQKTWFNSLKEMVLHA